MHETDKNDYDCISEHEGSWSSPIVYECDFPPSLQWYRATEPHEWWLRRLASSGNASSPAAIPTVDRVQAVQRMKPINPLCALLSTRMDMEVTSSVHRKKPEEKTSLRQAWIKRWPYLRKNFRESRPSATTLLSIYSTQWTEDVGSDSRLDSMMYTTHNLPSTPLTTIYHFANATIVFADWMIKLKSNSKLISKAAHWWRKGKGDAD